MPCLLQDLWPQYVSPRHILSVPLRASLAPDPRTSNLFLVLSQHHHPVVVNLPFFSTQPHSQTLLASPVCCSSPHFQEVLLCLCHVVELTVVCLLPHASHRLSTGSHQPSQHPPAPGSPLAENPGRSALPPCPPLAFLVMVTPVVLFVSIVYPCERRKEI